MEKTVAVEPNKWFALTKKNAKQVAEELLALLDGKHFGIVTHPTTPGAILSFVTSQTLKSNGKKPIRVEDVNGLTKVMVASSLETYELTTDLVEDAPDYERKNTHFFFATDQVKIVFRDSKGEKIYLFLAPEKHKT